MSRHVFEPMKLPEITTTKNGYQIRADILKQAQELVAQEFHFKWQGWEISVEKDAKSNQSITTVEMPSYPGLDKVLETAEKMYSFVTKNVTK